MRFQQSSKEPLRPQKAAIVINPESRTVDYFKQLSKYALISFTNFVMGVPSIWRRQRVIM
jgi:hypothetical protein